jgi:hypothetical protein
MILKQARLVKMAEHWGFSVLWIDEIEGYEEWVTLRDPILVATPEILTNLVLAIRGVAIATREIVKTEGLVEWVR